MKGRYPNPLPPDVLDLRAVHPPGPPPNHVPNHRTIMTKLPTPIVEWVRGQAELERVAVNTWLRRLVEREHAGAGLPDDCTEWLAKQAAQCGRPGDTHGALLEVLRHLAERWPNGARLR